MNLLSDLAEQVVGDLHQLLRLQLFAEACEPLDIRKKHRDIRPLGIELVRPQALTHQASEHHGMYIGRKRRVDLAALRQYPADLPAADAACQRDEDEPER